MDRNLCAPRTTSTSLHIGGSTLLWAGLLSSRAMGSLRMREGLLERAFLPLCFVVLAGSGLLLISREAAGILVASFLIGFGLGPLYPIMLARILVRREVSLTFMLAGVSAATMPFLTGSLSRQSGSLRLGLLVPAVGSVLLVSLAPWVAFGTNTDEF